MTAIAFALGILIGLGLGLLIAKKEFKFLIQQKEQTEEQLKTLFQSLSSQVLNDGQKTFLTLAANEFKNLQNNAKNDLDYRHKNIEDVVKPIADKLREFDSKITTLEKSRTETYSSLRQQIEDLNNVQLALSLETKHLSRALGSPKIRGNWAEIQLRRVVELAGMINKCDFVEQKTIHGQKELRPDLLIYLPGKKIIVVDAKCPDTSFKAALNSENDEERKLLLKEHARLVRNHVNILSSKDYWNQFDSSPEFVFMFLPSESCYSAALEATPDLIEYAINERVVISTPTTLITLLKTVHYGWRQESIEENAKAISGLGQELHERLVTMTEHFSKMGKGLETAVKHYNQGIGSFEARVLVSARKFAQFGSVPVENDLKNVEQLEAFPRELVIADTVKD